MKHLGILLIIGILVGCSTTSPTPSPATAPPTIISEPSLTPSPSETPIPTLSPQDIGMEMMVERDILAADGKSQMTVRVIIQSPANAPELGNTPVFFAAEGGGQFLPPSTSPQFDASTQHYIATSIYQAGFTENIQTVRLTATMDVFTVGRVQTETTITIQNEKVAVVFSPDCGYPTRYDALNMLLTLPFSLQTDYPELGGRYGLRFNVENGRIGELNSDDKNVFFTYDVTSGDNSLAFELPPDQPYGASRICVGVAGRDNIPIQCTAVLWGVGARRFSGFSRVDSFVRYYNEMTNTAPNTNIRLGVLGSTDPLTYFGVAYTVVWGGEALGTHPVYLTTETAPIPQRSCTIHRAVSGNVEPLTLFLDHAIQTPLIIEWRASTVGEQTPLTWVSHSVVGSHRLLPLNNNTVIELADGATLSLLSYFFDESFALMALSPDIGTDEWIPVLVRVDVPIETIDFEARRINGGENNLIQARSDIGVGGANMQIAIPNQSITIDYIATAPDETWQTVYLVGRVLRQSVRGFVTDGG